MSSNKDSDKIQKTVEASILDAITKIKADELAESHYDRTKKEKVWVFFKDNTAQKLWELTKEWLKSKKQKPKPNSSETLPLIKEEKSELKTLVLGTQEASSASQSESQSQSQLMRPA